MSALSVGVQLAWRIAAGEAALGGHQYIDGGQMLIGLCSLEKLLAPGGLELPLEEPMARALQAEQAALAGALGAAGLAPAPLRRALRVRLGTGSYKHAGDVVHRSEACRALFTRAEALARSHGAAEVTSLHLLAAILEAPDAAVGAALQDLGADPATLRQAVARALGRPEEAPPPPPQETPFLDRYGRDLVQAAREGKLHEPIGRRAEMLQVVRALARATKNNPVLIGDAGVGKTAIVEGLAWRIAQGRVPPAMRGKRIVQLDLTALVAGTKYRGEFETRLQAILREARASPEIILFIDEIQTLVGAGRLEGAALDAATSMKPALARGEVRVIGATTRDEYRRYIEQDPALERRFQPIVVNEPSAEEAVALLRGIRSRLEAHFQQQHQAAVAIADDALEAAVRLSVRYLPNRRLPDKAIDLLEEACAAVAVQWTSIVPGEELPAAAPGLVNADVVAQVVARRTGIPMAQLNDVEREQLLAMAEALQQRVVGQDAACAAVAQAVQRARLGLKAAGRPIAVLLFIGPTGVGKTELAKATAAFLFGSDRALVRVDLSEYQEKHSVSRLIGAPPGYVGHDEEGQLTGALRRTPHCVVLLDEVEKAHPEVLNLFLQLFDDGRLTDTHGRTADATNALFILTSNLPIEPEPPLGFHPTWGPSAEAELPAGFRARNGDAARQALLKHGLRPELVNRLDEVIVFRSLSLDDARAIADRLLGQLRTRLEERGISLQWTEAALEHLARAGYTRQFGAREVRRVIERQVENQIAGMMLRDELQPEQLVMVDMKDGALTFAVERVEPLG